MSGFSPLRFSAYARDLEQAILGISNMPPRGWPIRTSPQVPEATNVTPLPNVELPEAPKTETAVAVASSPVNGITGAGNLGASIADLIDAISAEVDEAFQGIQDSAKELRTQIDTAKGVGTALKGEADQIKAKLGRFGMPLLDISQIAGTPRRLKQTKTF